MTWRVAILGAGIGSQHLTGYQAVPDFAVTRIVDRDAAKGSELAVKVGATASGEIDDALADPDIDIIDICLPPRMHFETARAALEAGKHVICEKPVAGTADEAAALVALAARVGKRFAPVFQYRYGPAFDRLARLKAAGLLGAPRVASLETHWNRDAAYYAVPWRGTKAYEMGGAVLSHAIHIHDLIELLFGPVAAVSARLSTAINPIETEDCGAILFRMEAGALVTSSLTLGAADDTSRLRLVWEHATVESGREPYAPALGDWTITARDPARQAEIDAIPSRDTPARFAGFFTALAAALNGDDSRMVAPEAGVRSLHLAEAIYQSASSGCEVSVPPQL